MGHCQWRQTDRQRSLPLGILHSTVRGTVVWNIVVVLPYGYYYRTWYTGRARTWTRVGNGIRDTGDWRLETPGNRKEAGRSGCNGGLLEAVSEQARVGDQMKKVREGE